VLARRKSPKMGLRQSERIRSTSHLQHVRGFVCCVYGRADDCDGKIEAHHVGGAGESAMGEKAGDDQAVPLCTKHHRCGHDIGWTSFQGKYGVNLLAVAAMLWRTSPARKRMEQGERA
jgi:hypothetical protein